MNLAELDRMYAEFNKRLRSPKSSEDFERIYQSMWMIDRQVDLILAMWRSKQLEIETQRKLKKVLH